MLLPLSYVEVMVTVVGERVLVQGEVEVERNAETREKETDVAIGKNVDVDVRQI